MIKAVVVLAAVAIPLSAVQPGTLSGAPVRLASAQRQVDAAESAFEASPFIDAAPLSAQQRSRDLPVDPEAGFTLQDGPQGTVQMVTADGLGQGRATDTGHMVYSDAGAGYTLIAGRTAAGTRTIARLDQGSGPRSVAMFLRTPADTVMLGHTNGFVTINAATEAAPTLGMFTPAEARDSTGRIVQSSAVLQQVGPQLYQLSEVIVPDAQTAWPVYVDPGFMDFVKDPIGATKEVAASAVSAVSNVAEKVGDLSEQAASATWSGMKTVGNFVKENPLESAMIVGGVALSFTGVGSGAGAALIGAGVVNASATVMDAVAAHNPENQTLGNVAMVLDTASLITPPRGDQEGSQRRPRSRRRASSQTCRRRGRRHQKPPGTHAQRATSPRYPCSGKHTSSRQSGRGAESAERAPDGNYTENSRLRPIWAAVVTRVHQP